MSEDFGGKDRKKSQKYSDNKKYKKLINDDQKLENKAKKAFKNKIMEMKDDESWEDIEYYDRNK